MNNQKKIVDANLERSLGVEAYSELVTKISQIENQAKLLAKWIQELMSVNLSERFLETIYIPFLGNIMQFNELTPLRKSSSLVFSNFSELHYFMYYDVQSRPNLFTFDWQWQEGEYDFVAAQPINIYERFIYKVCGISYLELKMTEEKESIDIKPDFELRLKLKSMLKKHCDVFPYPDIIDFLPISLLEFLNYRTKFPKYPYAATHWLGQIHNENYLFYLAYLKERGAKIIGQPHGGFFSQSKSQLGNQMAEMILSDEYHSPMWGRNLNAFPNLRASRNLFINLKHITVKQPKKKLLVITNLFMEDKRNSINNLFYTNNMSTAEWYHKQLKDLKNHFSHHLDFKTPPLQVDFSVKCDYLKQLYPDCKFISDSSVQELSHKYAGVIHYDVWATPIIELAGTNIPQYAYLGPELSINKGYEAYLWNSRISSTREDYSKGAWIQLDNSSTKSAYGASYFYPIHYAKLIRQLMRQKTAIL